MSFTCSIANDLLQCILKGVKPFTDNFLVRVSEEKGWMFSARESAKSCMMRVRLEPSCFESFSFEGFSTEHVDINLSLSELRNILEYADTSDTITFKYEDTSSSVEVKYDAGGMETEQIIAHQQIKRISDEDRSYLDSQLPEEHANVCEMHGKMFARVINGFADFSQDLYIEGSKREIKFGYRKSCGADDGGVMVFPSYENPQKRAEERVELANFSRYLKMTFPARFLKMFTQVDTNVLPSIQLHFKDQFDVAVFKYNIPSHRGTGFVSYFLNPSNNAEEEDEDE